MRFTSPFFPPALLALSLLTACQSTQVPLNSEIPVPQAFDQAQAALGSAENRPMVAAMERSRVEQPD